MRVKDLPKVAMWQLERDSNPRPFGRKVDESTNEPTRPTKRQHVRESKDLE